MKRVIEDKPLEQAFAEVEAVLVKLDELLLPSLEAKVRDIREVCQEASEALTWLEQQVLRERREK